VQLASPPEPDSDEISLDAPWKYIYRDRSRRKRPNAARQQVHRTGRPGRARTCLPTRPAERKVQAAAAAAASQSLRSTVPPTTDQTQSHRSQTCRPSRGKSKSGSWAPRVSLFKWRRVELMLDRHCRPALHPAARDPPIFPAARAGRLVPVCRADICSCHEMETRYTDPEGGRGDGGDGVRPQDWRVQGVWGGVLGSRRESWRDW
jgi:hypothetical protein